jgi:hypothetical protein
LGDRGIEEIHCLKNVIEVLKIHESPLMLVEVEEVSAGLAGVQKKKKKVCAECKKNGVAAAGFEPVP